MSSGASAHAPLISAGPAGFAHAAGLPVLRSPGTAAVPPSLHKVAVTGEWPLRDTIELGSLPGAVPCARLHSRQLLWEWGLTRLSENAELLVTELMTNAVSASQSAEQILPVRLWLLTDRTRLLVLVWDASLRSPAPASAGEDAENGRGLLLVDAISNRWDWYFPEETSGKVVWALTRLAPRRGQALASWPPSTTRVWPVMNDDASLARNTAGPAISSGVAQRASGTLAMMD